jgi:hypothetical protein
MTIDELKDYIDERTRDMETTLLREFRKWAVRIEAHNRLARTTTDTLNERLHEVETRLDDIDEKRAG